MKCRIIFLLGLHCLPKYAFKSLTIVRVYNVLSEYMLIFCVRFRNMNVSCIYKWALSRQNMSSGFTKG